MRTVLITGTSSGIGLATSVELAKRGWSVVATMRDLTRRGELDRQLQSAGVSDRVRVAQLDVTDSQSIAAAIRSAGDIDVLVNNAGLSLWSPIELCPPDRFERIHLDGNAQ